MFEETQKHSQPPVQKCCSLRLWEVWLRHRKFFAIGLDWIGPSLIAIPPPPPLLQLKHDMHKILHHSIQKVVVLKLCILIVSQGTCSHFCYTNALISFASAFEIAQL